MAQDSSDAGKLMTKLLACTYDLVYEMKGSVTMMDKSFGLGPKEGRYIATGRSSDHFYGEVQMSKKSFWAYFNKLRPLLGRPLLTGLGLFKVMRSIENQQPSHSQVSVLNLREQHLSKRLNENLTNSPYVASAIQPTLQEIASLSHFQFLSCSLVAFRLHHESTEMPHDRSIPLVGRAFTFECLTTQLSIVQTEFHRFLVRHVFPSVSPQSESSMLAKHGEAEFWYQAKNIERLFESFDKFLQYNSGNQKKEFVLRLCFADMSELLADIEWHMNTADSHDHQTRFGISFVFTEMGFNFEPPQKRMWSGI